MMPVRMYVHVHVPVLYAVALSASHFPLYTPNFSVTVWSQ